MCIRGGVYICAHANLCALYIPLSLYPSLHFITKLTPGWWSIDMAVFTTSTCDVVLDRISAACGRRAITTHIALRDPQLSDTSPAILHPSGYMLYPPLKPRGVSETNSGANRMGY